jgi:ribonuclease E
MLDNEPTGGSGAGEKRAPETAGTSDMRKAPIPPPVVFMAPEVVTAPPSGEEPPSRAARRSSAREEPAAAKSPPDAAPPRRTRSRRAKAAEPAEPEKPADSAESTGSDVDSGKPPEKRVRKRVRAEKSAPADAQPVEGAASDTAAAEEAGDRPEPGEEGDAASTRRRRRRGRRGRGRGKGSEEAGEETGDEPVAEAFDTEDVADTVEGQVEETSTVRRRRRRRRKGAGDLDSGSDDPADTVVKVREPRTDAAEVQGVSGSTRLEAKRQRRRDGREQRRTRPPILTESEFLARREAVDRVMVVRSTADRTQIGVLEDGVLVEHYVTQQSNHTMAGNVYLGRVQNVLPSMEAAFVDIGRGRNAVLYAGEVNWDLAGLEGRTRTIEQALKPGDSVVVQVTKDPVGHKGARLTSHVTLSGRHLVYVPHGNASGISRKLPDTERKRLRDVLKKLVPEGAGVIVRTAAEGATEQDLERDIKRLQGQWEAIEQKAKTAKPPALLYQEPDLVIRVVRDIFNEDFRELVIQGGEAWDLVEPYLEHVSPELLSRVRRQTGPTDVFTDMRIDEQLLKALDRKVYLPSGGHLVIDRTEAMTVIDVNTGKFTGKGGNLEETVTRNNLEAAQEIVHQMRLRDIGGIIVIDFIDMVLESNRELVLRRLTECLGRDRTKHQVTEITSLGLVQMTRKRVGQGLLDVFSETCEHCRGRGVVVNVGALEARPGERSAVADVKRVAAASTNGERPVTSDIDTGGDTSDPEDDSKSRGRRRRRRTSSDETAPV